MDNLEMLLQPPTPAPSIKAIKKPSFMNKKKKTQKHLTMKRNFNNKRNNKVPTTQDVPLVCSDIRQAKLCKTNSKCFFDYNEFKCKDKSERPPRRLNIVNAAKGSNRGKTQRLPKGLLRSRSKKNNKNNKTTELLRELKKSFNVISNEARKDSNLIEKASERI